MVVTTTGVGFSLLALGLTFCGLRFFPAFQNIGGSRGKSRIGVLISAMLLSNALTLGILATGAFFFAENPEALYRFLLVSHVPLAVAGILGVYTVFYIFHPLVSPWPAVTAVSLLGILVIVLTVITHPLPFVDTSGAIDWNTSRILAIFLSYLIFIPMGVELSIFIPTLLQSKSREVKIISFVVVILASMGIVNTFVRFLLPDIAPEGFRSRGLDMMFTLMGLLFIGVFLLPPEVIKWISKRTLREKGEKISANI